MLHSGCMGVHVMDAADFDKYGGLPNRVGFAFLQQLRSRCLTVNKVVMYVSLLVFFIFANLVVPSPAGRLRWSRRRLRWSRRLRRPRWIPAAGPHGRLGMFLFNWARVLTYAEPRPEARSCSGEAYVFLPRVSNTNPQTVCAVLGTHRIPTHGTNPQLRLLRWYPCLLVRIAS